MPHRRLGAPAAALAVTALSGCALLTPPLGVPQGNAMCANPPEPIHFGTLAENLSSRAITLTGARLGDSEGADLIGVLVIPEIPQADGGTLTLGSGRDLATDSPDLWAVRQPVDGFVIQPGQNVAVAFEISRAAGADVATVASQVITYRIDGELFSREATSKLRFAIAEDCDAIED